MELIHGLWLGKFREEAAAVLNMGLQLQPLAKEIPKMQIAENGESKLQEMLLYTCYDILCLSVYSWSHQIQKKGWEDFSSVAIPLVL